MSVVELEIPPRPAYVGIARLALAVVARNAGFDEEAVDDLKIAVSEACTTACLNTEEAGVEEPVAIVWTERPDRFVIEVSDHATAPPADDQASEQQKTRRALSAALLESLVDEVQLEDRAGGGSCIRLTLRRR